MSHLSKEQLDEIVARTTANVLAEMKRAEAAHFQLKKVRIQIPGLLQPGQEVSWAPWTVALPPNIEIEAVASAPSESAA
ncbi:MAG TPA: hypothetical protein VJS42_18095 [Steroidobacteraceae bacterium]|nr:hypothetical protein [Steroidobacteraceae bacterium]